MKNAGRHGVGRGVKIYSWGYQSGWGLPYEKDSQCEKFLKISPDGEGSQKVSSWEWRAGKACHTKKIPASSFVNSRANENQRSTGRGVKMFLTGDRRAERVCHAKKSPRSNLVNFKKLDNLRSKRSVKMGNQPSDQQMLPIDHLLKAGEVSSILRVSRSCTYSLMQTGQIPTVHIGGARRVRIQDLVNFIEKSIVSAEPRSE